LWLGFNMSSVAQTQQRRRNSALVGVEIAGDVGVTSHVGDLLRRAIPSRLAGPFRQ
jgi:hypothetical protein